MSQTYEFWRVNRDTWADAERVNTITSATIVRDSNEETLGHAEIECSELLGEQFIRTYIVEDGNREALGTHLVQTPGFSFNGKVHSVRAECYTPLLELADTKPPYGYYIQRGTGISSIIYSLVTENSHAPMIYVPNATVLSSDFVADPSESWLSFIKALARVINCELTLDPVGRVALAPIREAQALQPTFTFTDDNSSILLPDISDDNDLYGIPNVVEVIYAKQGGAIVGRAVNDDPNSPVSTISRGREVLFRELSPDIDDPTQEAVDAYANNLLKEKSVRQHKIVFSHGYCGVRLGDCVMLDYSRAGIRTKAKIESQSIVCETGCKIDTTAIYEESML